MGKLQRNREIKLCESCGKSEATLYRIRIQPQSSWFFACSYCQSKAKQASSYQYGGTWKQKKRN